MPSVTRLDRPAASPLAAASGAPRPLLTTAARPDGGPAGTVTELRPPADAVQTDTGVAAPSDRSRTDTDGADGADGPAGPGGAGTLLVTSSPGAVGGPGHADDPAAARSSSSQAGEDPEGTGRIAGIARSVAQGALEVLAGTRPLQQLARWLDAENYERLQLRANLVRCIHHAPTGRHGGAVSSANRHVVVRSARVCPVSPGVYEASVVAYDSKRVRAVALRIERRRGAWRVTALEIG